MAPVLVRRVVFGSGGAAPAQRSDEELPEGAAEQPAHGTVEQEVDGTVDEHDDVPDVAERNVDAVEDGLVDAAQEREDALRQLGDDEAQDDRDQHRRRPVELASLL